MGKQTNTGAEPASRQERQLEAPALPYLPQDPKSYRPAIGMIGCGGITVEHLRAYCKANYEVAALCDLDRTRAEARRKEFYPDAQVYTDANRLLADDRIEVVDITTHPPERPPLIEAAIRAGKHVLSQKPFVLDLDVGHRLVELADRQGVSLAVNQNARWAPHFSYLRQAVAAGCIGELAGVHFQVHWDHNWVVGTEFDAVDHLILYDFAIHWFDLLVSLMGEGEPRRVFASTTRSKTQKARPPLLAQAAVQYDAAQATLVFDGDARLGRFDNTYVRGSRGTLISSGMDVRNQQVTLYTAKGVATPKLEGRWFPDGFHGTMGELLCAIEQRREPCHSARNNLKSLALCFAAVASSEAEQPILPGSVRRLP